MKRIIGTNRKIKVDKFMEGNSVLNKRSKDLNNINTNIKY